MGYTNEFNLEVGTTLNTSNIPKKLQQLNAELQKSTSRKIEIPITVSSKTVEKEVNGVMKQVEEPILKTVKNIYKEVNTYKDKIGNTFKEIKYVDSKGNLFEDDKHKHQLVQTASALQTLTTETHKFVNTKGEIQNWTTSVNNLGKTVQTRTKQYIDDTNQLVTETSEWGRNAQGQWQQLGNTIQKTQEIVKESTTSTSTVKGQIDDLGKSYQGLITTTEKVGTNGEYLRTVVSKYTDEMGRAVVKTEQFDKAGKQVATTMRQIGDAAKDSSSAKITFIDENGVKKVTQMVDGVKTLTTTTREYTSAQGALVKETKTLNEVTGETKTYREIIKNKKQLSEESKKLQEQYRKEREERIKLEQGLVSSNTTQTRGKTKQFGDTSGREYDALITTLEKVDKNGQKTIQTTYEFINAQGKLVQQTRITDEEGKKLAQDTITIKDSISQATKAVEILTTTTRQWGNSDGSVMKWTQTVDSAGNVVTKKVKEVVTGIGELTRTTQTAINGKNIGKAKTEIIEFADQTTTSINTVRGTIKDLGKSYNGLITTTERVSSNGEYLRTVVSKYTDEAGRAVEVTDQFNKAGQKVATTMRKIGEAPQIKNTTTNTLINKDGVKTVTEYTNGIATLRTETKQYTDTLGQLIQETNVYDEQTHKLISTHREELNNQKERLDKIAQEQQYKKQLTTTTKEVEQSIQREGESYKAIIKTIQEETAEYGTLTTTITTYKNKLGEIVVETEKVNEKGEHVAQTTKTVTKELNNASNGAKKTSNDIKDLGNSAEKANHGVKNLGWTLGDAISRLSNFYIASLPIRAVQTAITETIQTVKDFDSALIEFRKVSDLAGESLTNYVAKLAEMGEITGSTMQAMVEASTEFRKSGFSDEDSAKLASIAEKYRNIADEEISAGESASFIIAQMKAFNIEAGQAEHIIDSVNEVANNFSVSSADLAKNLGNMSEIMAINNVSMEQQIGMLTGVTEITRNASSASRGLVMISSRLTQVLDDTSSTGKKLTKIYNNLGIELKDENGQLRSHYDILSDLAEQWNSLSENEQKYIALTSAGARQQQNFVALMENWNQVANATTTAYKSMGSAQRENEKVIDSISKKVEILKSEFQQLVIGKGGLQDFAKTILNIGIAILKFANSDIGKLTITLLSLEAAIYGVSKAWAALKIAGQTKIIASAITSLIAGEVTLSQVTSVLTAKFIENATAFLMTPMGQATAFIAFIGALVAVTYKWATSIDSATKKLKKLSDQSKETESELENLKNSLHEIRESIDKINSEKLKITDNEQLEKLERETKELENQELFLKNQIALIEQRLKLEHREEAEQAKKTYDTKQVSSYTVSTGINDNTDPTAMGSGAGGTSTTYVQRTAREELERATEALRKNTEERNRNIRLADLEARQHGINTQAYQTYQKNIASATAEIEKAQKVGQENAETLNTVRTSLSYMGDEYKNEITEIDNATNAFINANNTSTETKENIYGIKDALNEENDALDENSEELSEEEIAIQMLAEAHNVAVEDLKAWAKELGISEEALVNYADSLGISVEKAYEFKTQLKSWNEQIDLLQSSFDTLKGAVDEYNSSQELSLDTIQALLSLDPQYLTCLEEENGQLVLNEQKIMNKVNALIEERKQTALQMAYDRLASIERGENAKAATNQASSIDGNTDSLNIETAALSRNTVEQYANRIARNDKAKGTAASQVVRELEKELTILDKIGNNYKSISGSAKSAGRSGASGAKQAKDAQKELNKELQDTLNNYKKVISWIGKQYDRKTDSIKDAKDEETKAIEREIKALEKEKDTIVDGLKEKKDALEKQKDAILDTIESEIKALENSREAREKYWDAQIDALKKANDARKDALELQEKLDALERARNTKVKIYKEGQGFVFDVDQTKVAEAQKALDEYLSEKAYEDELERLENLKKAEIDNYNKRIDALNDYKDKTQDAFEKQIDSLDDYIDSLEKHFDEQINLLNEHKEAVEEAYDAEIKMYEDYKQQFEDMVNAYEEQQNKLLAQQLTGIDFENDNWMTRLDNLQHFVDEYNRLQAQLDTGNGASSGTSGGGGSGVDTSNDVSSGEENTTRTVTNYSKPENATNYTPDYNKKQSSAPVNSKNSSQPLYNDKTLEAARKRAGVKTHASGISSIKEDEIAIVGENPNKEIVIGSKINNGELMSLGKGTGVVNADSSKTFAGMLNQVGQFGSSGFGSGNGTLNNNINNDSLVVNGVTIQGSNISDPQTFVNGLLSLKSEALQRAYRHR